MWRALVDDDPLALSRRKFDLLQRHVAANGGVASQKALAAAVWSANAGISTKMLDVYIG